MMFVNSLVNQNGFTVRLNRKSYRMRYPVDIWRKFPECYRKLLADTAAYATTQHLATSENSNITYGFPPPVTGPHFFYEFIYSVLSAPLEFPKSKMNQEYILKSVYNSDFRIFFSGIPYHVKRSPLPKLYSDHLVMPFSFGKDSLLTFAVAREIGLSVEPFFFIEPTSPFENRHKEKLRREFELQHGIEINKFKNSLGEIRDAAGQMWGWDLLLSQYTLYLLPFIYGFGSGYFFWSNERSTNEYELDRTGYFVNPTHEQNVSWMRQLNNLLRIFGLNTHLGSIIQPLHELMVLYILHHRYPGIGRYQLSCLNDLDKPNRRWCGECHECARIYIFLLAIGINPGSVGFKVNMLDKSKTGYYHLFGKDKNFRTDILFQSYGERLLAFYLAYKRGYQGDVMDIYKRQLLGYTVKHLNGLYGKYLKLHEADLLPETLRPKISGVYTEELKKFRKEIT